MRKMRLLLVGAAVGAALLLFQNFTLAPAGTDPTCNSQSDVSTSLGADTFYQFSHSGSGGRSRSYIVHVPSDYISTSPTDVVFVLHGGFGTACQILEESRINELPKRFGKNNWQ